jgi:hypothetical protein
MAKRFTAIEKWEDAWFFKLDNQQKLFWLYLLDKCDGAGIWEKNFLMASMFLQFEVTEEYALAFLGDKVVSLNGGTKWFIPNFIRFQHGLPLSYDANPHKPVLKAFEKYGIDPLTLTVGLAKGSPTLMDKDKVKDKVKDKDKDKSKEHEFIFPPSLDSPAFHTAWEKFKKMRAEIKRPLRQTAEESQLTKLSKYPLAVAIEAVVDSTSNQWQGVFPDKIMKGIQNVGTAGGKNIIRNDNGINTGTDGKYSRAQKNRENSAGN